MKKIAILASHLNFGGVESSIASQANALCDDYEVEIISTYKMSEEPAFKINDKVKITYLTDLKPNKEEFKTALKKKNIINIIKEGLKSLKILLCFVLVLLICGCTNKEEKWKNIFQLTKLMLQPMMITT